jgi:hypothetical protein
VIEATHVVPTALAGRRRPSARAFRRLDDESRRLRFGRAVSNALGGPSLSSHLDEAMLEIEGWAS